MLWQETDPGTDRTKGTRSFVRSHHNEHHRNAGAKSSRTIFSSLRPRLALVRQDDQPVGKYCTGLTFVEHETFQCQRRCGARGPDCSESQIQENAVLFDREGSVDHDSQQAGYVRIGNRRQALAAAGFVLKQCRDLAVLFGCLRHDPSSPLASAHQLGGKQPYEDEDLYS